MARLKELRDRSFLSQKELATKAGLSKRTINRLERGLENPRGITIRKLAAALGVEPQGIAFQTIPKGTPSAEAPDEVGKKKSLLSSAWRAPTTAPESEAKVNDGEIT